METLMKKPSLYKQGIGDEVSIVVGRETVILERVFSLLFQTPMSRLLLHSQHQHEVCVADRFSLSRNCFFTGGRRQRELI